MEVTREDLDGFCYQRNLRIKLPDGTVVEHSKYYAGFEQYTKDCLSTGDNVLVTCRRSSKNLNRIKISKISKIPE